MLSRSQTRILSHSSLTMGSSPIKMMHQYKPGGTMLLSRGKISARLVTTGTDDMGRWTYQTFSGKRNRNVTIVNAYQVCNKSVSQRGCYTAAAQQESLLRQRGGTTKWMVNVLHANYYQKPRLTSSHAPAKPMDLQGCWLATNSNRNFHACTLLMS